MANKAMQTHFRGTRSSFKEIAIFATSVVANSINRLKAASRMSVEQSTTKLVSWPAVAARSSHVLTAGAAQPVRCGVQTLTGGVSEFPPQSGVGNVAHKMCGRRLAWSFGNAQ